MCYKTAVTIAIYVYILKAVVDGIWGSAKNFYCCFKEKRKIANKKNKNGLIFKSILIDTKEYHPNNLSVFGIDPISVGIKISVMPNFRPTSFIRTILKPGYFYFKKLGFY